MCVEKNKKEIRRNIAINHFGLCFVKNNWQGGIILFTGDFKTEIFKYYR